MSALQQKKTYTFQEYLALEQQTQQRFEYYCGEVFAMAGGSLRHNRIIGNIFAALRPHAKKRNCDVFTEDVKLQIWDQKYYMYPDLIWTCDPDDLNAEYIIKKPSLLIEVLSDSTENYDRSTKVERYLSIPSVQYYMIVSQKAQYVGVYEKQNGGWLYRYYQQEEDVIVLEKLDLTLTIQEIYEDIKGLVPYQVVLETSLNLTDFRSE